MADNRLVQEVYSRSGRTRYYAADTEPNEVFNTANTQEKKSADYSFLSAESIGARLDEKRKEREDFKDTYLIDLDDKQRSLLNVMLEHSENPEEQIYKFATAVKYAEGFNIPLDFAYENLDAINRNWLGVGIEAHKGNFKAVADSFEIGINTLKMSTAGRDLMKAEGLGDEREIQTALEYLNDLESDSAQLQDKIPRNWLVNLLKSGANTVPYSAAVLAPSLAASAVNPALGTAVGFGVSAELQTGLEYWELRKAGVKKDIARNVALLSGSLQAVVETALGHVAGVTGKGLGADKVVSKLLTRLNAKGVFGHMGKALLFYGADVFEEGIEEAIQELVSAGGKELASVLQGEGVETDTAVEVAEKTWESFKGGLAGSLLLGVPGAVKFAHMNKTEATALQKDAISTPSEEAFIRKNKDNVVFEGMTEEDTKEELHNIFDAQKAKRERFQRSKINDYDEWLSSEARVEGEAVIDEKGNTVYETDEQGKAVLEADENGEVHKKVKRYGVPADVVRHKDRLYITEGDRTEYESGIVKGEYVAGDPTRETDDNDYGHIYYTQDTNKNTVKITGVEMMSERYKGIIKEFVRDFTEKFAGSRIIWEPKGETLQAVKNELIAENPTGKQNGLQYFADSDTAEEKRADIKLYERLKETMPQLSEAERHTAVAVFDALAQGAGMDAQTYLNTYYADEILTNKEPANMQRVAAQQDIEKSGIKGATDFTELANDIKALVYVSEKADFSTFVHEVSHVARRTMQGDLLQKAEKAFGVTDGKWTRSQEEKFAQGFEQYLKEGVAPTQELKTVFQKAAEFLARIYKGLQELLHINDDIRQVYDELLGGQKSVLKEAEQSVTQAQNERTAKKNTTGKHPSIEDYENNKIRETTEDKALDNAALKDKYMSYAKEHFQGNSYHNADTDTDIRVSRDIIDEWRSKTKSREQILSMQALDKLIESAVQTNTAEDRHYRPEIESVKYFEAGLTVNDKTYKAHLTVKEIQNKDNKAYHYYLEDVSLEDIAIDQIKKEAALRIDTHSKRTDVPLLHGSDTDTIAQDTDAVNSEESKNEEVKASYDKAANAARYAGRLSDEELKDMLFQTEQTQEETQGMEAVRKQYEGTDNIYFQTEKDFYDESAQAINKEVIKDDIEKTIIGEDVDVGRFYRMFYGDSEQRALYDKAFRDAITPELEEALKKDTKDEKAKNDTFIKIMQNKEVLRDFMKQYISASQSAGPTADMIHNLSSAAVFATLSYQIANGKAFTEKQQKLAMNALMQNVEGFRNVFARLNGYEALISLTKAEKAWTQSWAEATFNGQVAQVEQSEKKQGQAKSRSETQDALFLEEMEDDEKLGAFLKEASRIAFFNFDEFEAQDESDAQYRDELKRKQERIENVMRNQAWKSQLINAYHGKDLSDYAIKNIRGQMNNAARTYRSLYADIMERQDMRVKDADSTDEIIKTKLRSRKQSAIKLDELRLENMSAKEKEHLIQALDNEEMEQNIRKGYITLDDVGKIEQLVKAKNQNIKSLENKIQQMHEDTLSDKSQIGKLEQQLRDEKISRRVLADTIRARDVALKAVMRRINLKACNVDEAQSIVAVQWYLRGNVQKAFNATVDKAEPVIREAYALWKTSPEYRQTLSRMLSRKKEWGQLRNLFEYKDIDKWTADDKKLAARLVPGRNKFFSLGLYNRTEKNFYDMKTAAMSSEKIAQEAAATLGETLAARLTHRPLKQWTVDELIELAQKIDEVYKDGRKKYLAKKAALRAEAEGIRMDGISAFRNAKNWRGKALYKETPAAWSEEEKSKTGGIGSFLRKAKYVAMRPYAFIEMLDGGRQGTLYDLFEYEQRECNAVFRKNTDEKIDSFYSFLKDHKLDLSELDTKVVFDKFYVNIHNPLEGRSLTLTVKEILGVYLASFDERSREAVQYGNFAEQKERDFAQKGDGKTSLDVSTERRLNTVVKKAEELLAKDKRLSSLVTYLQKEYKEQGERLQKHDKEVNNKITEIVEHYFPMQRLDVSGEEDARQTQKKIQGEFATGTRHGIAKGQTKERTDISGGYQKPIKLDVISTYLQSVEANERLFAYDKYAQKLNRVVKGYGSERFIKDLETTYGREAVSYLNKQVNTIIDPTAGRVYSSTDKVLRVLRGNTAAAYLGWKLSGIIKQGITSPAPFLQYVNPINYTKAAVDWTIHHDKMKDFIYSRSILMKNRSFDMMQTIADELAQNAKTKAGKAITQAQQLGMQGLEWIDRTCVAPGWLAAYREEEARLRKKNASLEKPLSDNDIDMQASRYADDVLVRTQPSGRAEELAPLFREGGEALRMLLQFQSSLNVIYNNVRHDLPNAIRNKQYGRAAGIITGYALAGILVGAVTEGFGSDDDDDKDKIKRGVYYAFTQYTDSVPVINGIVDSVSEKLITGKTRYRGSTSIYAAAEKLAQGTAALSDADIQKAAARYAEAAGLTLGLPTSGTKEALYAAEQVFTGDIPNALWGRR